MTPFPDIAFINEEVTGCINGEAIGAINEVAICAIMLTRNPPPCFFRSCSVVSEVLSINRPESFSDFIILIISSISSFEMSKVNPFSALTAPCLLIFLSNVSNADEVALVDSLGKTFLAKETTMPVNAFLPKLPFLILVFCLVVRNNS